MFLTGEPGSGQTHVTRAFVSYLKRAHVEGAVTASTGIAATAGRAYHSFVEWDWDQTVAFRPRSRCLTSNEPVSKRINAARSCH